MNTFTNTYNTFNSSSFASSKWNTISMFNCKNRQWLE